MTSLTMTQESGQGPGTATAPAVTEKSTVAVSRRRVDQMLIGLGIVVTVVLASAGVLLNWGSNFADDYVHRELTEQKIFFPSADALQGEGRTDLLGYAEQQVTTGQDANAYASYINHHLEGIAEGQTYAELGGPQRAARDELTAAKDAGQSDAAVAELQTKVDTLTQQRTSLFQGETLRGLLLSSFAWWKVGQIAGIAALLAFVAAGLMAVLVVFGFVHLRRTHAVS